MWLQDIAHHHLYLVFFSFQSRFDMKSLKDDSLPSGVDWLCHPKAMMAYLSLLATSQKDATQEACIGALQNLTAKKGLVRETGRWWGGRGGK